MNLESVEKNHSREMMLRLKAAALPSHGENPTPPDEMTRRDAIRVLMGASSALALGLSGCERKPKRQIISRVAGPEYQTPGKALYYSSTWTEGPYPYGLMIKTVDGRPIKIEGNPDHAINRGTTSAPMQAAVLSLYDPDRSRAPSHNGRTTPWDGADRLVIEALRSASSVVLMTRSNLGPTERELVLKFISSTRNGRHFVHEVVHDGPRLASWEKIYGKKGEALPRFDRAAVILSLDSDFLGTDGAVLENIRLFTDGRQVSDADHRRAEISRLYVADGAMTVTGSNADHRIRLKPSAMGRLARVLLRAVEGDAKEVNAFASEAGVSSALLSAITEDLRSHRGNALVVAGPHLPEGVHAAVAMLNDALQAPGKTLDWNPVLPNLSVSDPADVEAAFERGVDVAILLDTNPVYDWPGKDFTPLLSKARLTVGHSLYLDETLAACELALPSSHNLESWNDAEPRGGVMSICQPVIAPLFDTRQSAESLLVWTKALSAEGDAMRNFEDWHNYLQRRWGERMAGAADGGEAERRQSWEDALRTGGSFVTAPPVPFPKLDRAAAEAMSQAEPQGSGLEAVFLPHHALHDGRFANNGWLQELPDPVSKVVWDNAASVSMQTAQRLGVAEGDRVAIRVGEHSVELPVLVQPGMADDVVALTLGHGRTAGGRTLEQAGGANVSRILGRSSQIAPRLAIGLQVTKGRGSQQVVRTQTEFSMHGRPIVLDGNLSEYREDAGFVEHKRHRPEPVTMFPPYDYSKGHKWAMAIDLGSCVGCNACVTACQAENNIPIVGRKQCANGREMHWIRIDRYLDGDTENPLVHQQPMLCQHCDNAPCESVCPVNATTHSPEGLNEMVYNRCVGTRYCSNNCPYKVRRFNFSRYHEVQMHDPVQELVFNPQVTVRGIGVMEKCTFCIQRINEGKFLAKNQGKAVEDGGIRTACQQACPAQAITFGDLNDAKSKIAKMHAAKRAFFVLEEYNVKPNVAYLARVRNPHPALAGPTTESRHG